MILCNFFLPVATGLVFVALIAVGAGHVLVTESIHLNQIKASVQISLFMKALIFHKNKPHLLVALYYTICFSFSSTKNNL